MHTWRPFCLQSLWLHLSAISVSTHEDLSVYSHSKHISLLSQYSHIKTFLCTVTMSTFVKSQWDGSSNALFSSYLSFSSSGLFLKSQTMQFSASHIWSLLTLPTHCTKEERQIPKIRVSTKSWPRRTTFSCCSCQDSNPWSEISLQLI